jgi:GAF domain-containing protein
MSKRERHLKQRLDELFSSPAEAEEPSAEAPLTEAAAQPLETIRPSEPVAIASAEVSYLKAAIDQLPLPAYLKDREHTWLAVNSAFAQLIDARPEDLLGHTDKEQADEAWQLDDHVMDSGQFEETQEAISLPDGTICTRQTRHIPLGTVEQKVRYVMGVVEEHIAAAPAQAHPPVEAADAEALFRELLSIESRRAVQLQTAAEVSQAVGTILDIDELLPTVVDLIQQRFNLYYVGLFLVDDARQSAVLRAGTGDAGRTMLERSHQLAIDERSMIGWCVANRKARVALDVGQDAVRFDNPLLPDTRSELALPLVSRGRILGAMTAQSAEAAAFSEQDVAILQTMSDQVATAIANAQLFEQTRRHSAELALINRVITTTASSFDLNYILDTIAAELTQALALGHVGIALLNEARTAMTLVADQPIEPDGSSGVGIVLPLAGNPSTQQVIATQRPMVIPDAQTSPLTASIHEIMRQRGTQALMILPIVVRHEVIGTVGLDILEQGRVFTSGEMRLAETLIAQASKMIENVRLFEQAKQNTRQLAALNELSQAVSQQVEIEQVLEVSYQQLKQLAPVDAFFATLYDRDSNTISFPLMYDEGRRYAEPPVPFNPDSKTGTVIRTGESILILLTADELAATVEVEGALGNVSKPSASLLYVPLQVGTQTIGSLSIQSYQINAYTTDTVQLMGSVANQVAIAIQNARLLGEARARAQREQTLREITSRVRGSTDPDVIARTAIRELGLALGRQTFIRLGGAEQLSKSLLAGQETPASGNSHDADRQGGQ